MGRSPRVWFLATAFAMSCVAIGMTTPRPALAQVHMGDDQPADFDFFYGQLTPYGNSFEHGRAPEPPSRAAVPAQNFQSFQQRPASRPAYAAAPENRPVPERGSPQRPVEAPQQREERPRDRGRRELPR